MFTVDNSMEVRASRAHVWAVLTSFETFEQWHPYVWISGRPLHDELIRYGLKQLAGMPVRRSVPARMLHLDPGRMVGWRLSIPRLMTIEESYSLSGSEQRTIVFHQVRCEGSISGLVRRSVSRRLGPLLETSDAALAARLLDGTAGARRPRSGRSG